MNIETIIQRIDLNQASKIITLQVNNVTCIECCKYFIVPTTAICGHTLCHKCWHGRRSCPTCGLKVDKKSLKLNLMLQNHTDHVHSLTDTFQELFNIKLDELLFSPDGDVASDKDPNKNVSDWLSSSQNHFSAPVSTQHSQEMNEPQKVVVSDIQVHTKSNRNMKPANAIFVPMEQKDWDKIEELPDTEDILNKDKENIIGPMDIETYVTHDDFEYSTNNPRRSSRKKEIKESGSRKGLKINKISKNSQKWNNVKKMKKEFNKLNKNKNKLNVSIEMCKNVKSGNDNIMNVVNAQQKKNNIEDERKQDNSNTSNSPELMQSERVDNPNTGNIHVSVGHKINEIHVDHNERASDKMEVDKSENNLRISVTNQSTSTKPNVSFFKKNVLIGKESQATVNIDNLENGRSECFDNDDIQITIKIGTTLTNICIKKKDNDVQLKINSDREVQTSVAKTDTVSKVNVSTSPIKDTEQTSQMRNKVDSKILKQIHENSGMKSQKSSVKKNTASADTATINNMEITASIEKELSTVMENMPTEIRPETTSQNTDKVFDNISNKNSGQEEVEYINDLDIFDSESVKEGNVQALKDTKQTPSAILMSTNKSKIKTQKNTSKRDRELSEVDATPCSKKSKLDNCKLLDKSQATQKLHNNSDIGNYDEIMSQVFANIDADIKGNNKNTQNINILHTQKQTTLTQQRNTQNSQPRSVLSTQNKKTDKGFTKIPSTQKYSENIFSLIEKDIDDTDFEKSGQIKNTTLCVPTKANTEKVLDNPRNTHMSPQSQNDIDVVELSTPVHNDEDSDKSVVEETPQKNISITRKQQIDGATNKGKGKINNYSKVDETNCDNKIDVSQDVVNIVSYSETIEDSTKSSRNVTVVEQIKPRITLETPISINKFVDQIKHKSTPVARKSLDFNTKNDDNTDMDQTLCPTAFEAAKNTQEIEIMKKAFEQHGIISQNVMVGRNNRKDLKYYLACSCLSFVEKANVKQLCSLRNWVFVDNYVDELTHLIVGVDEEKKAQRSVKFMCALAASKWIIAYDWVQRCLQTNQIVDEEPYEALDAAGEAGPRRSRLAKLKLFHGIKFYCMPPFGVLDVDTLKVILEAAGGKVVNEAREVKVTDSPALLLAEPESTQEDKFIYLAMELSIVPLNYEWVLNCLGSYTLCSIHDLLLCPSTLLPSATSKWPLALISREYD